MTVEDFSEMMFGNKGAVTDLRKALDKLNYQLAEMEKERNAMVHVLNGIDVALSIAEGYQETDNEW